jgi:tetratricopeptide (TPR) repeat protein
VTTEIAGSTGSAMVLSAARQSEKRRGNPTAADLKLRARALSFQPQSAEKFEREQALLRQALKLEPGDSSTELELATLLWVQARNFERDAADKTKQKKLFDEARKLAARASAEEPDNLRACRLMGNFALEDGELEVARGIFERCLAVDPKARALLGDLASTWMYDGTEGARKAIALFRKAAEIEGSHPHEATQMNLGEALFVAGDSAAALEPLQLTLRLNPEFGEAEFYLALAYADLGDLEHMKAHTAAIAGWIETIKREKRDVGDFASFKGFEKYNSVKTPGYQTYRDTRLLPLWRKAGLPP